MIIKIGAVPLITLAIVFFVLKVVGVISWSWWLVTLPMWIIPAMLLAFLGVVLAGAACMAAVVVAIFCVAVPIIYLVDKLD